MLIEGLVGAGIAQGAVNTYLQYKNMKYMQGIQQDMFNREDNAVQRRAYDLKKAGLSPVLAAGSAAQSGPVVSTVAPQVDVADKAQAYMNLTQQDASISATKAQELLTKQQIEKGELEKKGIIAQTNKTNVESTKELYDLDWYRKHNIPTNASTTTKTIGGLEDTVKGMMPDFDNTLRNVNKVREMKHLKPLTFDEYSNYIKTKKPFDQ